VVFPGFPPLRYVVLAGPTASGKSEIGLRLAERFGGEIVNADSRQVYRFLDIGTAKPSAEDRRRVPHHLYDLVTPDRHFDAARYGHLARAAVQEIAGRGRLPIVVGGTGLYIRALHRGLFAGPAAHPALRAVLSRLEQKAPGTLYRWCRRLDPGSASRLHPNDAVRLVRALEVTLLAGVPLSAFQSQHRFAEPFGEALFLALDPGTAELDRRIAERTRRMFSEGLLEEVRRLRGMGYGPELPALRSIGYREALRILSGEWDAATAVAAAIRRTRQFARRQRIWFRAEPGVSWTPPDLEGIAAAVEGFLGEAGLFRPGRSR
jgi:tRNA dimethylallyltransferase